MNINPIPLGVTTLDYLALALVIGAAASWLYLLAPYRGTGTVFSAPLPLLGVALALLCVSASGDLIIRTAALADVELNEAWPYLGRALTHSDYGSFWQLRTVTWLLLVVLALRMTQKGDIITSARWVALGALVIAFVMSSTGHAGDSGTLTWSNLMNALHIAGVSLWGGTVIVYAVRILPHARHPKLPAQALALTATRLSTLAGVALGIVLVTGLYNAWHQLPNWAALWDTAYGQVLLVKLAIVAVMAGIGAINRFIFVPGIERQARQLEAMPSGYNVNVQRFLQLLRVDAVVFLFILVCAALLGAQTPPAHLAGNMAPVSIPN